MSDILNLGPFEVKTTIDFSVTFPDEPTFTIEQHALARNLRVSLDNLAQQYRDIADRNISKYFQSRGCVLQADDEITTFYDMKG